MSILKFIISVFVIFYSSSSFSETCYLAPSYSIGNRNHRVIFTFEPLAIETSKPVRKEYNRLHKDDEKRIQNSFGKYISTKKPELTELLLKETWLTMVVRSLI